MKTKCVEIKYTIDKDVEITLDLFDAAFKSFKIFLELCEIPLSSLKFNEGIVTIDDDEYAIVFKINLPETTNEN